MKTLSHSTRRQPHRTAPASRLTALRIVFRARSVVSLMRAELRSTEPNADALDDGSAILEECLAELERMVDS